MPSRPFWRDFKLAANNIVNPQYEHKSVAATYIVMQRCLTALISWNVCRVYSVECVSNVYPAQYGAVLFFLLWLIIYFYFVHYDDVIMTMLASQITSLTVVYSIVYSGVNQRRHQSSASLAFVWEIHRGPVNFPHKWPVTRKMFPFDDVIMYLCPYYHINIRSMKY